MTIRDDLLEFEDSSDEESKRERERKANEEYLKSLAD